VTLREAARALRSGSVSSQELTRQALDRIDQLNPSLNAFLLILRPEAMESAARADRELTAGEDRGPLHGIPVALKDLFHMRGVPTTGGSKVYGNDVPDTDSAVVERLTAAGAVILGKLNLHELAYGITSDNPHFGPVRNPWNREHIAGGSSGGSAVAVAAGMVFASLGTDTGGSIRIPAALCGTVGVKPTYGLVSRFGVMPLGFTLDHAGPLAGTVRDAAAVLNAIAGHDSRDSASARTPVEDFVPGEECSIRGIRIGYAEAFFTRLDPEVDQAVRSALALASSLGAEITSVTLPDLEAVNTLGRMILLAEAAAVHGNHMDRRDLFGRDVLSLLDQGRLLPATMYIDAQRARAKLQAELRSIWGEVDCVITPTIPIAAPRLGQDTVNVAGTEEEVRAVVTRFTRFMNFFGIPAVSLPCGLTSTGLPVALQVAGPAFGDGLVLRVAAALEDGGLRIPPVPLLG
jgi:aspartyl-tRNA(Asn)/glutamyl-tRNA(Gln) amidotransferase subunit A